MANVVLIVISPYSTWWFHPPFIFFHSVFPPFSPVTSTLALPFVKRKVTCSHQAISFLAKRLYSSGIVTLLHNIICSRGNFLFFTTSCSSCIILEGCIEKKYTELSMWLWETRRAELKWTLSIAGSEYIVHRVSFSIRNVSALILIEWNVWHAVKWWRQKIHVNTSNTMDCVTMNTDGMDCFFLFHCYWKCIAVGTSNEIFLKSLSIMSTSRWIVWYLVLK